MPFTPFHFGVGLAAKAAAPRRFRLAFFVALQIVTDLESLYNLAYHREPVHRFLHTFAGATLLAVLATAAVSGGVEWWRWHARGAGRARPHLFASLLMTALFATWSHVLLDGVMHRDARPFWPIAASNSLLNLVGIDVLHLACVGLGLLGLIVLAFRWPPSDAA